jgi:hypothetical protein
MKTLFIRPFLGELPKYMDKYMANTESLKKCGFEWLIFTDREKFIALIKEKLGIDPTHALEGNLYNPSEFRPAFGLIFEDYLKGYDFWGHTDHDVVYGRLDRFMSDEFLSDTDIYGNDPEALCGPFSIYRNTPYVNNLFKEHAQWKEFFLGQKYYAFDELGMSDVVRKARDEGRIRFKSGFMQEHDKQRDHVPTPQIRMSDDGSLSNTVTGKEMMMFHFQRSKVYPL